MARERPRNGAFPSRRTTEKTLHGTGFIAAIARECDLTSKGLEKERRRGSPPRVRAQAAAFPLGATIAAGGVNFSVFSRQASRVELLLFDDAAAAPTRVINLDRRTQRTYHYWHALVPGAVAGQV